MLSTVLKAFNHIFFPFVYLFSGSLGCWSHLDPVTARLRGLGHGLSTPTGQFSLKDVVYQDAGTYKCIGQSPINKKKLEVLQTVGVTVKGECKFSFISSLLSVTVVSIKTRQQAIKQKKGFKRF